MKCLVFGAGGYMGGHLAQALADAGHAVVAHARRPDAGQRGVDLSDRHALAGVDWDVDRVFLFAGVTGTAASFEDHGRFVQGNDIVLLNMLDAIRRSSFRPRLVFPSSRLVYRGADHALPETAALEAKTLYAANKISCELYLQAYANAFELPYTVFRVGVPYGNRRGTAYSYGTVGNFIQQATQAGRIRMYGDGRLRRTFTHIDDICRTLIDGATRDDFANETFNLPGEDLSLIEAAELIAARLDATIEHVPWPALDQRIESGSTVFDSRKLLARLPRAVTHQLADWAARIPARREH